MKRLLILLFINIVLLGSCSRQPSEIKFREIKGHKNRLSSIAWQKITDKCYTNSEYFKKMFKEVKETSCRVLSFETDFKKPIGVTKIKYQLVDSVSKYIINDEDTPINPELDGVWSMYRFSKKGKFTLLIIVNDVVRAKGDITIK